MKKILDSKINDIIYVVSASGEVEDCEVISIDRNKIKLMRSGCRSVEAEFYSKQGHSNLIEFGTVLKYKPSGYAARLIIPDMRKAYKIGAKNQQLRFELELNSIQLEVERRIKSIKLRFEEFIKTKDKQYE